LEKTNLSQFGITYSNQTISSWSFHLIMFKVCNQKKHTDSNPKKIRLKRENHVLYCLCYKILTVYVKTYAVQILYMLKLMLRFLKKKKKTYVPFP